MYVYALAQEWGSAPGPDDMEKRGGGGEGKGEDAGVGVVDMPVIAPEGATAGDRYSPSWGGALTPAAPVGPRPRHSQRLPAADR